MILRDIIVSADSEILYDHYHEKYPKFHHQFQKHLYCISDHLLARIWYKVKNIPITQIFLKFYINKDQYKHIYIGDHALKINRTFDFDHYLTLEDDIEKKRTIANRIREELQVLFSEQQWDFEPIRKAFQEMEDLQYVFEGIMKLSWVNPNKKYRAKMWFSHCLEEICLEVILYKNNRSKEEICRRKFTTLAPTGWCVAPYVANVHWVSETILESQTPDFARKVTQVDFADVMQQ
jgi:hypothetical protein